MTRHSRHTPGRPLSLAQKRALVALVRACAEMGSEAGAHVVSAISGLKPNVTVLALRGLVTRRLAIHHDDDVTETWSPTLAGRKMAGYVRAREPRTAPVTQLTQHDH